MHDWRWLAEVVKLIELPNISFASANPLLFLVSAILICHCEATLRSRGNLSTMRYFFGYELPKSESLFKRLMKADGLTVAMKSEYFQDNA